MLIRMLFTFFTSLSAGPWLRYLYFRKFVNTYLKASSKQHIMDAGFGGGEHIGWIGLYLPEATITGYDTAEGDTYQNNLKKTSRWVKSSNVHLKIQDLKLMTDHEVFDAVYCVEVLEHIPDNQVVLQNIYHALKTGGLFYMAMPYHKDRPTLFPKKWMKRFHEWAVVEHIGERRSLEETTHLLQQIGFQILEKQYTFGLYAGIIWETELLVRTLPFGRYISKALRPIFNALISIELILPTPKDGNLRIVARK